MPPPDKETDDERARREFKENQERLRLQRQQQQQGAGGGTVTNNLPAPQGNLPLPKPGDQKQSTLTSVLGNQLGVDTDNPWFWPKYAGTQGIKAITEMLGLPRVAMDIQEAPIGLAAGAATGKEYKSPIPKPPSTEDMNRFIFGMLPGFETDLKGPTGKTINEMIKSLGGGALFRGGRTLAGAGTNLLSGATAELAGQAAEGSPYELPARVAAGGAPGAIHGSGTIMRTTPARVARDRLQGLTDAEIQDAIRRQAEAQAQGGIWLSPGEATRQGPNAGLLNLEGNILQTPQGVDVQRLIADRMGTIQNRHGELANQVSPGVPIDPVATDRALGTSASRQIDQAKADRSADADFLLDAGKRDKVPLARVKAIIADIDAKLADPTMDRGSAAAKELQAFKSRLTGQLPKGGIWTNQNVGALHGVLEDYEAIIKAQAFQGDPQSVNAVRVHVSPYLDRLRSEMMDASDRYRRGWQIYTGQTTGPRPGADAPHLSGNQPSPQTERVQRLEQGAAGDIKAAQPGTDYPNTPPPGTSLPGTQAWKARMGIVDPAVATPATIRRDVSTLDATTQQQVLRQHLEDELANAFQPTQGQPAGNVKGGATYANKVAGAENSRRGQNLYALIDAVTGSPQTAEGYRKFIDVVRRTGQIPGAGSPTHGRGALAQEAKQPGGIVGSTIDVALSPVKSGVMDRINQWRERGTYGELAEIIRQPNSMQLLHELALLNPNSARAQAIVRIILGGGTPAAQDVKPTPEEGTNP